jgi:hypothetical protein
MLWMISTARLGSAAIDAYAMLVNVGFGLWADYRGIPHTSPRRLGPQPYAKILASRFVWIYSERMGMLQDDTLNTPYLQH